VAILRDCHWNTKTFIALMFSWKLRILVEAKALRLGDSQNKVFLEEDKI
jgi:hypothetical protein